MGMCMICRRGKFGVLVGDERTPEWEVQTNKLLCE